MIDVTQLLHEWSKGDAEARDRVMPLVYEDLKVIAQRHFKREAPGHTLRPTAIVNELFLRLVKGKKVNWENRRHFFAVMSKLIRRILVDHARKRHAGKRWVGAPDYTFDEAVDLPPMKDETLIRLNDGLEDLEQEDPRGSQVVELHAFGGLTFDEIAELIGVARRTVMRDWRHARLWLRRYLEAS